MLGGFQPGAVGFAENPYHISGGRFHSGGRILNVAVYDLLDQIRVFGCIDQETNRARVIDNRISHR